MTDDLLERWSANNDRLHWIQTHREELQAATGITIPYRLHALEAWLDGHKGVVTRKLRDRTDADADDGAGDADTVTDTDEDTNDV